MTTPTNPSPELTRAAAYNWLGKNHFIPANRGAAWLHADLVSTLATLTTGSTTTLDYRGALDDAPHFTLSRSVGDEFILTSHHGPMDAAGNHTWTWQPSELPDRPEWIVHDILRVILACRNAPWVELVPPADSVG